MGRLVGTPAMTAVGGRLTHRRLTREGLVTAFRKRAKLDGDRSSTFASHPSSIDRADHMQRRIDGRA